MFLASKWITQFFIFLFLTSDGITLCLQKFLSFFIPRNILRIFFIWIFLFWHLKFLVSVVHRNNFVFWIFLIFCLSFFIFFVLLYIYVTFFIYIFVVVDFRSDGYKFQVRKSFVSLSFFPTSSEWNKGTNHLSVGLPQITWVSYR